MFKKLNRNLDLIIVKYSKHTSQIKFSRNTIDLKYMIIFLNIYIKSNGTL